MPSPIKDPIPFLAPTSAVASLQHFCAIAEAHRGFKICYDKLVVGDKIRVASDLDVIIDETSRALIVELDRQSREGSIPLNQAIRDRFSNFLHDSGSVSRFASQHGAKSDERFDVPLSVFLQERSGNCATMAMVFQIAVQERGKSSYFIQGVVSQSGNPAAYHAWNITDIGTPMVCDVALGQRGQFNGISMNDGFLDLQTPTIHGFQYSLN